jgi:hypothetical protein
MISPIPYRHIIIDTHLSAGKAASALSGALGSLHSTPSVVRWFQGNPRAYKGRVSRDEFIIKRVYPPLFYSSFLPVLYGRFDPRQPGTQIDVQITLRPIAIILLAIFFLVCAYQTAFYAAAWISAKSFDKGFVYMIVILLFGYGTLILSFNHQADAATDFIHRVFKRYHLQ